MGLFGKLFGGTPVGDGIHDAARKGDLKKVKTLLNNNPTLVFIKDGLECTPLHLAALSGHRDVAALLLANKADVNAKRKDGSTPLHDAAFSGHKSVAELLLTSKADVSAKDNDGSTPLHMAALRNHKDMADFLLANNADINAKDNDGDTPSDWMGLHDKKDVAALPKVDQVERAWKSGSITGSDALNQLIQLSVKNGCKAELIGELLEKGADKEVWDEKGYALLHHAAVRGQAAVVEALVRAGADKEARTKDGNGMTPLLVAAATGQASVVEVLIRAGSNTDAKDNKLGLTPLGFAESLRHTSMIEMLRNASTPGKTRTSKAVESQQQSQNLLRWQQSGFPQKWVNDHHGQWNHSDWQDLLEKLNRGEFWPMERDAIGRVLEEQKRLFAGSKTLSPTISKTTPNSKSVRWERRGNSIQDTATARSKAFSGTNSEYIAIFDPKTLIKTLQVANFAVTAIDGMPILSVKVEVADEDINGLCDAVQNGKVDFRCNCHKYPTFPIIYSRLLIRLRVIAATSEPNKVNVRCTLAEDAGNFTNADIQDWVTAVEKVGRTKVYVYNSSNELLVDGSVEIKSETIEAFIKAVTEADAALRNIRSDQQDWDVATQAFFRDHPKPEF